MDWLRKLWCSWTHGGGDILRDEQDRINWRCRKCGRWSDSPVSHEDAARAVNGEIRRYQNSTAPTPK